MNQLYFAEKIGADGPEFDFEEWVNPIEDYKDITGVKESKMTKRVHLPYYNVGGRICHPAQHLIEKDLMNMKLYLDLAHKLGAEFAVVHPGLWSIFATQQDWVYSEQLLESLKKLTKYANSLGLQLGLENSTYGSYPQFWDPEQIAKMVIEANKGLGSTSRLYAVLDTGHFLTAESTEKYRGIDRSCRPLVKAIKDANVPIGELHLTNLGLVDGKTIIWHPPISREGLLDLKGFVGAMREFDIKPDVITLETAMQTNDDKINAEELMKREVGLVRELFDWY